MKVCYTGGAVKDCGSYYSVATNAVELRIWFLTDDILRIRAGFDGDWDEASYSLTMTAWESRTDELMKDCRKRVQSAAAALTDGDRQAVIQGARLKVVIEKAFILEGDPERILHYGSMTEAEMIVDSRTMQGEYPEDDDGQIDSVTWLYGNISFYMSDDGFIVLPEAKYFEPLIFSWDEMSGIINWK